MPAARQPDGTLKHIQIKGTEVKFSHVSIHKVQDKVKMIVCSYYSKSPTLGQSFSLILNPKDSGFDIDQLGITPIGAAKPMGPDETDYDNAEFTINAPKK